MVAEDGFGGGDEFVVLGEQEPIVGFLATEGQIIAIVGIIFFVVAIQPILVFLMRPIEAMRGACRLPAMRRHSLIGLVIIGFIIKTLLASAITIFWSSDEGRARVDNWRFLFTIGTFVVMIAVAYLVAQGFINQMNSSFVCGLSLFYVVLAIVLVALYTSVTHGSENRDGRSERSRLIFGAVVVWINLVWTIGVTWVLYKIMKIEAECCRKALLSRPAEELKQVNCIGDPASMQISVEAGIALTRQMYDNDQPEPELSAWQQQELIRNQQRQLQLQQQQPRGPFTGYQ